MEGFKPPLNNSPEKENKPENKEIPYAPEGWMTNGALFTELKVSQPIVQKIADIYNKTNPEYFNKFKDKIGKVTTHYSPELVQIITEEIKKFKNIPEAPEGWMNNDILSKEIGVDNKTIKIASEKYTQSNPEYFKEFKGPVGRVIVYYSPELVNILKKKILSIEKAPEGWMTSNEIAKELSVSINSIKKISDRYAQTNPEYFKEFRNIQNKPFVHCSPELVAIIKKKILSIEKPAEDWMNNNELAKELKLSYLSVKNIADKYLKSNPEYFNEFMSPVGVSTYYSPELVEIVKKEVQNVEKVPEGWMTSTKLSDELGVGQKTVQNIADKYLQTNPGYFKESKDSRIKNHYSPELVEIIKNEILSVEKAPEGWMTSSRLSDELGVAQKTVQNIADKYLQINPEYFKEFKSKRGQIDKHYSSELVEIIKNEILSVEKAPEGWITNSKLSKELKVDFKVITKIANKYFSTNPEYFKEFRSSGGNFVYYSPELVEIIKNEILSVEKAPDGWATNSRLTREIKVSGELIKKVADKYLQTNPEYFKEFRGESGNFQYYSPELVEIIKNEILSVEKAPEGWIANARLAKELDVYIGLVQSIADKYTKTNPEYFRKFRGKSGTFQYYSPELVKVITEEINKIPKIPEGWLTSNKLSDELGVAQKTVQKIADRYLQSNPDYFKESRTSIRFLTYYSPELIQIITEEVNKMKEQRGLENQENVLKTDFENLAQEIANEQTSDETARKISELIRLLPGNAHDIILKYHPRYKGLRPEYVKEVIADYLGDFMLSHNEWHAKDIQKLREVMDIEGIKEEIIINLKNACLTFVNTEKKSNHEANEQALVEAYFQKEEMLALAASSIPEVDVAMKELREYYNNLFELQNSKPNNVADSLREGRIFPDINQLVNIQEIRDKKKMLIADEMGLGKSASSILAKEYLGLKCALVVVPSNVEDTWKNYLSDKVNENGKQIGYFKNGLSPKTLSIESAKDLEKLKTEVFDYIIISQEKISGERYSEALNHVNFDMMIVDEVHKLKNIESGVRSQAISSLSEKIQGEDKYLALLSGTPVPNKVKDIGISLKLLYPEKYKDFDSKEMVKRILYGDLIDLRSELLKRMQMKELAASIEMPELTELDINVDLAPEEREIYEILLEEDELTALDKILVFRQFLLNPEILKVEPGFIGSKVKKLSETLNEDLKSQDKITVFVNGYIEGVIRGKQNIIEKMNLSNDVIIEEIHGEITQQERKRIEDELKSGNKKTVVFVSGQTADVGVDFSGADGLIFYNEPWSNYEKRQQRGRVYREGLKNPLTVKTLLTKNSIEEGIRNYSNAKERAIQKLLKGINNTEAEKKLLYNDSKLVNNDVETNAQLSKEYLSDWEKLMIHFGQGFESGEKRFRQELGRSGKEYAELYKKLGRLTYQGNNARVTATMLERMIDERKEKVQELRILDIASGPEMLKESSTEKIKNNIISTDINAEHFTYSTQPEKTISASYLNLPALDKSTDYVNLGFAFHQTSPIKYYKKNYERLQVLAEMNRVLKPGGRAVISMLHNVELVDKDSFNKLVSEIGFKVVPEYSGESKGGENYRAKFITLEKVSDTKEYKNDAIKFASADNARYINELGDKLGRELLKGLEMTKVGKSGARLRDQRRMIDKVVINGKEMELIFNKKDEELFSKEVQTIKDGEELRAKYGGIQNIPLEEIKRIGFERKLETPGYYLLYKIIEDGGAVIIRGDYKSKKTTIE